MKSTTSVRSTVAVALLLVIAACGGGASSPSPAAGPAPQPLATDVERTAFDPSLNVHLDKMVRRPSGLYVQDVTMGTGAIAVRGRTAVVRYTGWRSDGKQFDDGEVSVTLGSRQTIAAWEEGLLGMRVGGKRRLVVPPNLGYGERGAGADIPPNSVLVFDMSLQSVY